MMPPHFCQLKIVRMEPVQKWQKQNRPNTALSKE